LVSPWSPLDHVTFHSPFCFFFLLTYPLNSCTVWWKKWLEWEASLILLQVVIEEGCLASCLLFEFLCSLGGLVLLNFSIAIGLVHAFGTPRLPLFYLINLCVCTYRHFCRIQIN
jgi:hypothetical protein